MKKAFNLFRWVLGIALLVAMVVFPDTLFAAGGVTYAMANFITTSVTYTGKQNMDIFLRPMFVGAQPWETAGIRVIPNVQSNQLLNYMGTASKILKAYAKGFNGATGTTYTQRTLITKRLKAEASDDALEFYQTVMEQGLKQGDWNDLTDTDLLNIILSIYQRAVKSDVFRIFWLGDTAKEQLTTGVWNGVADTDYNQLDGIWKLLMADASATPNDTQIYRHVASDGAVAKVNRVTLTAGSSANLILDFLGVSYTEPYVTSLAITATNFIANKGAAIGLRGYTVASGGSAIIDITSKVAGVDFTNAAFNGSSAITGTTATQTANTAPAALAAGESEANMQALLEGCDKVLKQVPPNEKVFLVSDLVYDNYVAYLESLGTLRSQQLIEEGQEMYKYRGIRVIPMGWDVHLNADFAHGSGALWGNPHRIILTEVNNLVLGMDVMNAYNQTDIWFNKDAEENRFRMKLIMGAQYVHNKLTAVSY